MESSMLCGLTEYGSQIHFSYSTVVYVITDATHLHAHMHRPSRCKRRSAQTDLQLHTSNKY